MAMATPHAFADPYARAASTALNDWATAAASRNEEYIGGASACCEQACLFGSNEQHIFMYLASTSSKESERALAAEMRRSLARMLICLESQHLKTRRAATAGSDGPALIWRNGEAKKEMRPARPSGARRYALNAR